MSKTGNYIVNIQEKQKDMMVDCQDFVRPLYCGLSGRECNINDCPNFTPDNVHPSYHHSKNILRG